MGNNNNGKQRQQQQQQPQQKKRYKGKNIHPMSGVVQMGQHAMRLIKNMAFGNFNIEKDGIYFQNQEFLRAALHEVEEEVKKQSIYCAALHYAYGSSTDVTVIELTNQHKRALDAWTYVYNTLLCILNSGDITLLVGLLNRLQDYRYVM